MYDLALALSFVAISPMFSAARVRQALQILVVFMLALGAFYVLTGPVA